MTFVVSSESDPEIEYSVDLVANNGAGFCDCEDWHMRCAPRLKQGLKHYDYPHPERVNCKHIHACLLAYAHALVQAVAERLK